MDNIIRFITGNWSYILSGLFVVVAISSAIVKFTPNKDDDKVLSKILGFLDHLSIAKTSEDKQLIELAKKILNKEGQETN